MNIHPIHTEQDYKAALKAVSPLFDNEPEPGTPEGDFFDVMVTLIEAYEAQHSSRRTSPTEPHQYPSPFNN